MDEKIMKKLECEFLTLPMQFSQEEFEDLVRNMEEEFERMHGKPSKIFAKKILEPTLILDRQQSKDIMLKLMPNRKQIVDFDIKIKKLQYENITIYMIGHPSFQSISLNFVLPYTEEEKKEIIRIEEYAIRSAKKQKISSILRLKLLYWWCILIVILRRMREAWWNRKK